VSLYHFKSTKFLELSVLILEIELEVIARFNLIILGFFEKVLNFSY